MREAKNARGIAGPTRACSDVLSKQLGSQAEGVGQGAKRRNGEARFNAPGNARIVKVGSAEQLAEGGGAALGYFWTQKAPRRRGRYSRCSHRLREIDQLFRHRYPIEHGVLPENRSMSVAFAEIIAILASEALARNWIFHNLVALGEISKKDARDIVASAFTLNQVWSDDQIGELLCVTRAERDALGLTAIGAIDFNQEERKAERLRRDRERKRASRARAKCGTSRPISAEQLQSWRDAGVSRRTWYRRRAEKVALRGTEAVANNNIYKGEDANLVCREIVADKSSATGAATFATFVLQSIAEPKTLAELANLTGKPKSAIKPILSRLRAAGKAAPIERGIWQAVGIAAGGLKAAAKTSVKLRRPQNVGNSSEASVDRLASALRILISGTAAIDIAATGRRASARPQFAIVISDHDNAGPLRSKNGRIG